MRNLEKIVMNAKIPSRYQLTASEWLQLAKEAKKPSADAELNAVFMAFKYGFVLGQRCEKKRGMGK